jgi:hypothetical protein
MATEPFLINPPRRMGKRRRRNPIGETLVTIGANPMRRRKRSSGNPWYGNSRGHRIAALMRWGGVKRGRIKKRRVSVRRRRGVKHLIWHGRRTKLFIDRANRRAAKAAALTDMGLSMFGKSRFISGKGWVTVKSRRRRRKSMARRRKNAWFGQRRRHRKAARKGWKRGHTFKKRRYRKNAPEAATNPRRKRYGRRRSARRGYRRNPALSLSGVFSGVSNVREWAPLAVTGGLSAITGAVAPGLIGVVNPWAKLGVQLAVAVGGSALVEKAAGSKHANAWMVVGVSMVGYQLLKQFVLVPYFPQFAVGLGQFADYNDYYLRDVSQEVGAFPQEVSAFPGDMSDYPGVGAAQEVGSYPFDGRYGY